MGKEEICSNLNRDLQDWTSHAIESGGKGAENIHPDEVNKLGEIYKKHQIPICNTPVGVVDGMDIYYSVSQERGDKHLLPRYQLFLSARYDQFLAQPAIHLTLESIQQMSLTYTPAPLCRSGDKSGSYVLKTEKRVITIEVKEPHIGSETTHITVITDQEGHQKRLDRTSLTNVLTKAGLQGIASRALITQYHSYEMPDQFLIGEWQKAFAFWTPSEKPTDEKYIPEEKFNAEILPQLERKKNLTRAAGKIIEKLGELHKCQSLKKVEKAFQELQKIVSSVSRSFSSKEVEAELKSTRTKVPSTIEEACQQIIHDLIDTPYLLNAIERGLLKIAQKGGRETESKLIAFAVKSLITDINSPAFSLDKTPDIYNILKEWQKLPKVDSNQYNNLVAALEKRKSRIQSQLDSLLDLVGESYKQKLNDEISVIDQLLQEIKQK